MNPRVFAEVPERGSGVLLEIAEVPGKTYRSMNGFMKWLVGPQSQ